MSIVFNAQKAGKQLIRTEVAVAGFYLMCSATYTGL
jgi:hypothetical protein